MAKNRDYTGLLRTPPSMAWLIRERARLQGIIDRCDRVIDEHARRRMAAARQLASLDAVFPLHEIKVEPTIIDGVRPHKPRLVPHGALTKAILACLREAAGTPRITTEIALYVAHACQIDLTKVRRADISARVHRRLKSLQGRPRGCGA
jgi:hypothetical protein